MRDIKIFVKTNRSCKNASSLVSNSRPDFDISSEIFLQTKSLSSQFVISIWLIDWHSHLWTGLQISSIEAKDNGCWSSVINPNYFSIRVVNRFHASRESENVSSTKWTDFSWILRCIMLIAIELRDNTHSD